MRVEVRIKADVVILFENCDDLLYVFKCENKEILHKKYFKHLYKDSRTMNIRAVSLGLYLKDIPERFRERALKEALTIKYINFNLKSGWGFGMRPVEVYEKYGYPPMNIYNIRRGGIGMERAKWMFGRNVIRDLLSEQNPLQCNLDFVCDLDLKTIPMWKRKFLGTDKEGFWRK